jgi:transposase
MAMGRQDQLGQQEQFWIAHTELPRTVAHPFYEQLNRVLEARGFDEWVEQQCARFYAERMGRPSLAPGRYFRLILIGYFEELAAGLTHEIRNCSAPPKTRHMGPCLK